MSDTDTALWERVVEAERRAAAAEARLAAYEAAEAAQAEAKERRRAQTRDRVRKLRASKADDVTRTEQHVTDGNALQSVTPPPPAPSPGSPHTPLITPSSPPTPVSPASADADRSGDPGAAAPPSARKASSRAPAKFPHFPVGVCDAGHAHWVEIHGPVDYARYRKALGTAFRGKDTDPTAAQLIAAQTAYREAVAELSDRDAEFANIEKFAGRLAHWVTMGTQPYVDTWGVLTERGRVLGTKGLREQYGRAA